MSDLIQEAYQAAVSGAASARALAFQRLREALRQLIDSGRLPPGSGLPSERELAEQLDLSRVTVRRALAGLVEDGLLVQRQGAGTFVAERLLKSISKLSSFTDDLRARGLRPRAVVLERELGEVTPIEAMALNLSPGAGVSRMTRLRYAGDEPLAIERSAVQVLAGKSVVFVEEGDTFVPRSVTLGRPGETTVEVVSGLTAGTRYVAANSFLVKAELAKSEAEHEE